MDVPDQESGGQDLMGATEGLREKIVNDLASHIDRAVVNDLLEAFEAVVAKHRRGDLAGCLAVAGRFVEHVFRAVEFIRTGTVPAEIKSPAATARAVEVDTALPEPIRILVPRVALAMIYDLRSKRDGVHVKEVDPQYIDAALAVSASSWIIAELLRLYHDSSQSVVAEAMQALMRANIPFIEAFGDELVVTREMPCEKELLLLLEKAEPDGLDRRFLGKASKHDPSTVTRALKRLERHRQIHKMQSGCIRITGPGEKQISDYLATEGGIIGIT
jgi:hypothetical protein